MEAADIVQAWTLFHLLALSQLIPCIAYPCFCFTKRKRAIEDVSWCAYLKGAELWAELWMALPEDLTLRPRNSHHSHHSPQCFGSVDSPKKPKKKSRLQPPVLFIGQFSGGCLLGILGFLGWALFVPKLSHFCPEVILVFLFTNIKSLCLILIENTKVLKMAASRS